MPSDLHQVLIDPVSFRKDSKGILALLIMVKEYSSNVHLKFSLMSEYDERTYIYVICFNVCKIVCIHMHSMY